MTTERTSFPTNAVDLLQLVMDNIPQFIFWKDRDSVYLGCNQNFARAAGVEAPEAIVGKSDFDLAWKNEEAEFFRVVDRRVMESGKAEYHIIEPQLQADGKQAWLDTNKIPLLDAGGRVVGILGTFEDITERVQAERALRERESHLRTLLDSLAEGVIATDAEGRVTRMNPAACELTGWSAEQATGRPLLEVYQATDLDGETPRDPFAQVVGLHGANACDVVLQQCGDVERTRYLVETATPMGDFTDLQGIVLVVRDVTDQRRVEERLRHVQRMEAVGQLAGGVAHDFNNLLTGVMGTAEALHERLTGPTERRMAEVILETSARAADLTRKLLAFSRRGRLQLRPVSLHALIDDVVAIMERSVDRSIELAVEANATRFHVMGDPAELQTVLLNLALNARDAMPRGGTLCFRTANTMLDEGACGASAFELRPNTYLRLEVQDTGSGMTPEVQSRIFEPFFTTKPTGKGTGLGLAAVYGAVLEHHGAIEVHSTPGEGTRFYVFLESLERSEEEVNHTAGKAEVAIPPTGITVLVVDDEEIIRRSTEMLLSELGYGVMTAGDGVEALETYRRNAQRIDLVLLDMVMPLMGGQRCLQELRALDPGVRVLISSGFTAEAVAMDSGDLAPNGFLNKPYRRGDLADAVRKALHGQGEAACDAD